MKRYLMLVLAAFAIVAASAAATSRSANSAPCQDSCSVHDMGGMHMNGAQPDMSGMGPHMTMTPSMPAHSDDSQRADRIVQTLRTAIEKYRDYRVAEQGGYVQFLANVPQPQYHFTNWRNAAAAEFVFDPARPTSLLYKKTANGFELTGAMYTAPRNSTLADLDARVPLSIAHWHEHVNFCKAPQGAGAGGYFGPTALFGLAGSIATEDACRAAGGTFVPVLFNWMVHVYPFATNRPEVWKLGH
jgi:hypothetical protein